MNAPVRISFRQNGEYLMAGQNEANQVSTGKPLIPPRAQNVVLGGIVGGTLIYFLVEQYRKGESMRTASIAVIAVIVVMAFWLWLFKKIGLWKEGQTAFGYSSRTEKDLPRYQKYHRKLTGQDELQANWEFSDAGICLLSDNGPGTKYEWTTIMRANERPGGLLIFSRPKRRFALSTFLWFPKTAFVSDADYATVCGLVASRVPAFQRPEVVA